MESYNILIVLFGIIILGIMIILFFINNLLLKKERVKNQFESVNNYINDRIDLFARIASFVESNSENEEKYVNSIYDSSDELSDVCDNGKYDIKKIKKSFKVIEKYIKLGDIYPDFNKNRIYTMLKEEIILNEERIVYAMESYDKAAKNFNELKTKKIYDKISKIFKIEDYEYYNK